MADKYTSIQHLQNQQLTNGHNYAPIVPVRQILRHYSGHSRIWK